MTRFGTWVSFSGDPRLGLALVMALIAAGMVLAGGCWRGAAWQPPPVHRRTLIALLVAWVLAIAAFLVCAGLYVKQLVHEFPGRSAPTNPITLVTLSAVVVTFIIVLATRDPQDRVGVASAIIAALAAPMVFELPFDVVVMARTYPPIAPDPTFYRALFFAPLLVIELTTLALLMCSPEVRVNRWTCFALAGMFGTFAIWASLGFGYPDSSSLIAANVVSKLLAFIATIALFFPVIRRSSASPAPASEQPSDLPSIAR